MKAPQSFLLLVTAAICGISLADQASIRQLACPFDILPLAFTLFLSMLLIAFAILRKGSKMYRALCSHFSRISQETISVGKDLSEVDKDAEVNGDAEVAQEPSKDEEAANLGPGLFKSTPDEAMKKTQSQSRAQKKKEKKLRQQQRAASPVQQQEKSADQQGKQIVTLSANMDEEKDLDVEQAGEEAALVKEASWCEDWCPLTPLPGPHSEPATPSESTPPKARCLSGARRRDLPPPPTCLPPLPPKEDGNCEVPMVSYSPALLLMHRELSKKIALGPPGLECPDSVLATQGQRGLHAAVV